MHDDRLINNRGEYKKFCWSRRFPIDPLDEEMDEQYRSLRNRSDGSSRTQAPLLFLGNGFELNIFDANSESVTVTTIRPATSTRFPASMTATAESRGGAYSGDGNDHHSSALQRAGATNYSKSRFHEHSNSHRRRQPERSSFFQPVTDLWSANVLPTLKKLPKVQIRVEPTTTLKIRKTFRPLKTIIRLSAHFNTQQGVWQFRSTWEDAIIGSKLTLAGRELQLAKSWQLSMRPVEDLVTRLRLRAAVDWQTWKGYVRIGFRTERLSPINVMEGFTLLKQIPLDGNDGHIKLEVRANFALPEPEIEYSTETQRSLIGMGDVQVGIEELNLLLDF